MRLFAILLFFPFLSGCFAFGYPAISSTPSIQIHEPEVHAFRVVSGIDKAGNVGMFWDYYDSIDKVHISKNVILAQTDLYFRWGIGAISSGEHGHSQSLEVLLYKRGFETISIPAISWLKFGDRSPKLEWKKAESLVDLEKAIGSITPYGVIATRLGRDAEATPEVWQFIANEYTWLANSKWVTENNMKDRQRLLRKAEKDGSSLSKVGLGMLECRVDEVLHSKGKPILPRGWPQTLGEIHGFDNGDVLVPASTEIKWLKWEVDDKHKWIAAAFANLGRGASLSFSEVVEIRSGLTEPIADSR